MHVVTTVTGVVIESLFCGANAVVYGAGTWILLSRKGWYSLSKRDTVFLALGTTMFALAIWVRDHDRYMIRLRC